MTARILIFGGCGNQGQSAARAAIGNAVAGTEIVIASRSPEKLSNIMVDLPAPEGVTISGALCDILNPSSMADVLRRGDVVLNAAAPFFQLGNRVAKAAIAAGADYFDICDDWEATAAILELDASARQAGVSVVTGFGLAPGVSSMLAVTAAERLDQVNGIYTIWSAESSSTPLYETIVPSIHFMQCCIGPIHGVRDGRCVHEAPLKTLKLDLPDGSQVNGATIGSPESLTLAHRFPGVTTSLNVMLAPDKTIDVLSQLAEAVRSDTLTIDDAARLISDGGSGDGDSDDRTSRLFAFATGLKDGYACAVMAEPGTWLAGGYDVAGRALGLAPLLRQKRTSSGCMSVEAAIAPNDYFTALATELNGTADAVIHVTDVRID
jgi:Saccharopine dehydrogenase NADP binding domain